MFKLGTTAEPFVHRTELGVMCLLLLILIVYRCYVIGGHYKAILFGTTGQSRLPCWFQIHVMFAVKCQFLHIL